MRLCALACRGGAGRSARRQVGALGSLTNAAQNEKLNIVDIIEPERGAGIAQG